MILTQCSVLSRDDMYRTCHVVHIAVMPNHSMPTFEKFPSPGVTAPPYIDPFSNSIILQIVDAQPVNTYPVPSS